jgi:transposase
VCRDWVKTRAHLDDAERLHRRQEARTLRAARKPAPSLTSPSYGPGEMAERDWSPYTIEFTAAPRAEVQAFSYVLTYSPRKAYAVYPSNDLYALMDGHVQAFDRFKGLGASLYLRQPDTSGMALGSTQPLYNPRFLAFAVRYEFRPRCARSPQCLTTSMLGLA